MFKKFHQKKTSNKKAVSKTRLIFCLIYQLIMSKKFDSTANLTVSIVNDLNPDNALIIVIDGVLFYDALNNE